MGDCDFPRVARDGGSFGYDMSPHLETLALTIRIDEGLHEPLIAELAEIGFDAFAEEGNALKAYGPVGSWREIEAKLMSWLRARLVDASINVEVIPAENWNAKWEATIKPLQVGSFVIAPTWAELGPEHAGRHLILIDPKMSFGTGFHESTRLALRLLEGIVHTGDNVLDIGTGTGVLAIAALKLGAGKALGFDFDMLAVESAQDNAVLNGVQERFEVREGTIEAIGDIGFQVIALNMISSRLTPIIPQVLAKLAVNGSLILSGILKTEREMMLGIMEGAGFRLADEAAENDWWGCVAVAG